MTAEREALKSMKNYDINTNQRQLSEHIYMSLNTRHTDLNNNILVVGGSGAGKTFRFIKPTMMTLSSSFVVTDPKGEILRDTANFMKSHGYNIKVLNLLDMLHSNHFNPFVYIRDDTDVIKLVSSIMQNTSTKEAASSGSDPFWDNACEMLLQALVFYVIKVEPPERQTFRRVMELLAKADFTEDARGNKLPSDLDRMFAALEDQENIRFASEQLDYDEGKREDLPDPVSQAVQMYNGVMKGAADTVRSIIITAKARLRNLTNKDILNILDYDEMNLRELGLGMDEDGKTKTVLYCVIPDNDKSYNFLVGILYTQIFKELYAAADMECGGKLPIHVTFALDEFANVALPDDFCSLLSTMRGREISCIIIIQNMAQIKALFKDTWETIPGNCDVFIYLGGNEQSTHEYVSKLLGKGTYDKQTSGVTKSKQGSTSKNEDVIGRELMLPSEVRKVDGKYCLIFIRGFDPVLDKKIQTQNKPMFKEMNKPYQHPATKRRNLDGGIKIIPFARFEKIRERDKNAGTHMSVCLDGDMLMSLSDAVLETMLIKSDNNINNLTQTLYEHKIATEMASELSSESEPKKEYKINIEEFISDFSREKLTYLLRLRKQGFSDQQIRALYPILKSDIYSYVEVTEMFDASMSADEIEQLSIQLTA